MAALEVAFVSCSMSREAITLLACAEYGRLPGGARSPLDLAVSCHSKALHMGSEADYGHLLLHDRYLFGPPGVLQLPGPPGVLQLPVSLGFLEIVLGVQGVPLCGACNLKQQVLPHLMRLSPLLQVAVMQLATSICCLLIWTCKMGQHLLQMLLDFLGCTAPKPAC